MKGFLVPVFELIAMLSIYSMISGEVQNLIFIALGALGLVGVMFLLDHISDSGGSERASSVKEAEPVKQTVREPKDFEIRNGVLVKYQGHEGIVRMPKKKAACDNATNETVKKPSVRRANYDEYQAMDSRERAEITFLDLGGCDFRTMSFINICRDAENLTWVELSNTIIDPRCMVYCMDDHLSLLSRGAFTDDNGIICWPGEGNTPSHAYESRRPVMKTFQEATDRERRAYLGLNEQARIRIVWHKEKQSSPTSTSSVFSDRPERSGRSKGGSIKPSMLWTPEDEYMTGGWMDDEE